MVYYDIGMMFWNGNGYCWPECKVIKAPSTNYLFIEYVNGPKAGDRAEVRQDRIRAMEPYKLGKED